MSWFFKTVIINGFASWNGSRGHHIDLSWSLWYLRWSMPECFSRARVYLSVLNSRDLYSLSIAKKQLAIGRRKTIQNWIVLHTFCVELVPCDKATFSGPDAVRTIAPQSGSIPLRTQLSRRLKVYQLCSTEHWKLTIFLHIVNYHPKHQLSLFKVISPCTELWSCGMFICRLWGWIL